MSRPASARIPRRTTTPVSPGRQRLQRRCVCEAPGGGGGQCADCREEQLQRSAAGEHADGEAPAIVHDVLRSPGQPLPPDTRAFFEARFGGESGAAAPAPSHRQGGRLAISEPGDAGEREADALAERVTREPEQPRRTRGPGFDFSRVRVHADARAAESARAVSARAYTVGHDIVFGASQYAPSTPRGRELLAHELAHTTQQAPRLARQPSAPPPRPLRPHVAQAPRLRSAAAVGPPCSTTGCPAKIPGSAEGFIPGGARGEAGAPAAGQPSVHLRKYMEAEAPEYLEGVQGVLVVATRDMEAKRISWSDCPKPAADDPSAGCILVSAAIEQQAAAFNRAQGPTIGGRSPDDWSLAIRRQLSWAADQIRFRRSPTAGLPAENAGAMWELQALHGWLSGFPVDYRRAMSLPTPEEQQAQLEKSIDFWVEGRTLGVRGILTRLRCLLPCAAVDESITRVFGEVTSGWPREMRDALLFGLMDPRRGLAWPPRPGSPRTMTFPAEPRPKMGPLYVPRTGFEGEAGRSGENL